QRRAFDRVLAQVLHDALHRAGILPRAVAEQPALAHQAADADVLAPVLARIADAHDLALGADQPARALDLQEEELDRSGRPGDLEPATGERAGLDLGTLVVRHEAAVLIVAAEQGAAGALFGRRLHGPGADEVGGHGIDRHIEARPAGARAGDLG